MYYYIYLTMLIILIIIIIIFLYLVTSEELLNLYAKRAYTIGKDLNLITESNYTEALRMAKYYDQLRKSNPEQVKYHKK